MLRAVADTNVVVSALLWRGAPHRLFGRIEPEQLQLYSSRALLSELEGVLVRRKLARAVRSTGKTVAALVSEYRALVRLVAPRALTAQVARDPDDDAVIACALAAQAQLLVSGDKDLRSLHAFGAIRIVSPAEALHKAGGMSQVAQIARTLGAKARPARLAALARIGESADARRLGYLLELAGHEPQAKALDAIAQRAKTTKLLDPTSGLEQGELSGRWKITVNWPK